MIEVTDQTFETHVLKSELPVLVDFWAPWCGPCTSLAPILVEISQDTEGYLTVAKMDIDVNPYTPAQYGIRSIPSLVLFGNGKVLDTQIGLQNKKALLEWIRSHLEKNEA